MTETRCSCCGGDRLTVCDACGNHSCWAGRFMCDESATAGTRQVGSTSRRKAGGTAPRGRDYRGEIAGVAEAAEIVGVQRQRLHELRKRPDFPAVAFALKSGDTWWVADLRAYAAARAGGRGRKTTSEESA